MKRSEVTQTLLFSLDYRGNNEDIINSILRLRGELALLAEQAEQMVVKHEETIDIKLTEGSTRVRTDDTQPF